MNLSDHLPRSAGLVTIIVVGMLALYTINKFSNAFESAKDATTSENEAILHQSAAFQRRIAQKDSLLKIADIKISNLRVKIASLNANLSVAMTPSDTIGVLTQHIVIMNQACSALDEAYSTCKEENSLLKGRITVLESSLASQLKVGKCHFLFMGCLSRVKVAEVSLVIGMVTGYYLGSK